MSKYWITKLIVTDDASALSTTLTNVRSDSSHNPETSQAELSSGAESYAGTNDEYVVNFEGEAEFADIVQMMKTSAPITLQFTDGDGTVQSVSGFSVVVWETKSFQARTRTTYTARFVRSFI